MPRSSSAATILSASALATLRPSALDDSEEYPKVSEAASPASTANGYTIATGGRGSGPVAVVARGERSSLFALVAAGLEEKAIGRVELHGSLGSLKEVIEQNWTVNQKPELFCFGLLESFDVAQLAALVAPRPVELVEPSDRARRELARLDAWYNLMGSEFKPFR